MNDFCKNDPITVGLLKQATKLDRESGRLRQKARNIQTRKIIKYLPLALSLEKWRVQNPDLGSASMFEISFEMQEECQKSPANTANTKKVKVKKTIRVGNNSLSAPAAAAQCITPTKKEKAYYRKKLESYYDFYYRCDTLGIRELIIKKCHILINYNSIRFASYEDTARQDIFAIIRDLKLPLKIAPLLEDIEYTEKILAEKRAMLKEFGEQMLFAL